MQELTHAQREALEQRVPALRDLRIRYIELCEACAHAVISGTGIDIAEQKRQSFLKDMSKRQRELLRISGIDLNTLPVEYGCVLCRDTGIILEGGIKKPCQCRIAQAQRQRDMKFASFPRFDDFRSDIYKSPKQKASAFGLMKFLKKYVSEFPDNKKSNILLYGNTGLGKTFFVGCLTRALHEKGIRCEMIPAYELFESFRKQHMGEAYVLPRLSHLPFLAIDDLGVEPMYRNITVEYFNELLDFRLTRKLPTVIATNLDNPSIRERYGERILSRINDQDSFDFIGLQGNDLRERE